MQINKNNYSDSDEKIIIELYLQGYNAREIGMKVGRTKEAIQKKLQDMKKKDQLENKKELDNEISRIRRKREFEKKETLKALNYENNKFMSDKVVALKNPSAYKVNEKGDWILDKDKGYVFTEDMPKRLNNTELREYEKRLNN